MAHTITTSVSFRQVGRSRITDHFWTCSCGDRCTAPNGFSTERDAHLNGQGHRTTATQA